MSSEREFISSRKYRNKEISVPKKFTYLEQFYMLQNKNVGVQANERSRI